MTAWLMKTAHLIKFAQTNSVWTLALASYVAQEPFVRPHFTRVLAIAHLECKGTPLFHALKLGAPLTLTVLQMRNATLHPALSILVEGNAGHCALFKTLAQEVQAA